MRRQLKSSSQVSILIDNDIDHDWGDDDNDDKENSYDDKMIRSGCGSLIPWYD